MKMKEFGSRGGARPWNPLAWIRHGTPGAFLAYRSDLIVLLFFWEALINNGLAHRSD